MLPSVAQTFRAHHLSFLYSQIKAAEYLRHPYKKDKAATAKRKHSSITRGFQQRPKAVAQGGKQKAKAPKCPPKHSRGDSPAEGADGFFLLLCV